MGVLSPIKDMETLGKMKDYLRERSLRNYLIFRVGINLGLSVQELLQLRVEDVANQEVCTFQKCRIQISPSLQKELQSYIGDRKEGYLFTSSRDLPLSRFQLYMILQDVAQAAGYKKSIGALTLRKTFAYWAYVEKKIELSLLSKYLNHPTVEYTLGYLGISESKQREDTLPSIDL